MVGINCDELLNKKKAFNLSEVCICSRVGHMPASARILVPVRLVHCDGCIVVVGAFIYAQGLLFVLLFLEPRTRKYTNPHAS